jgi:hypothetical protein
VFSFLQAASANAPAIRIAAAAAAVFFVLSPAIGGSSGAVNLGRESAAQMR